MRPRVGVRRKGTRTKTKQKSYYSGKKKKHTLKSQVVIETESLKIICTAHGKGKKHDFQLFKGSKIKVDESIEILADKGYQVIKKIHNSSYTPKKKRTVCAEVSSA